ncbi:MAG TPA: cupin domain-containing protein [Gemmatimonadaceae bacterium]|nr:cupin domain-containing protein [Gemmatimonadaceae bacterium]
MTAPTCRVITSGAPYIGQQGFTYLAGLTAGTAGSRGISMTVVLLPDGARARTHLHRGIETAVYVIEGETEMYFGDALQDVLRASAGDYVYVPADMPHLVINRSGAACRALVAHTAADDQEGIVLLPELDALV